MKYGIVSCVFTAVLKPPQLQPEVTNYCLSTVQTALNFAACSFCCKITLIWLGSSLSVVDILCQQNYSHCLNVIQRNSTSQLHTELYLTQHQNEYLIMWNYCSIHVPASEKKLLKQNYIVLQLVLQHINVNHASNTHFKIASKWSSCIWIL